MNNLYIAGSSVFPTGSAIYPTITLTALALRLSKHIASKLKAVSAAGSYGTEAA